MMQIGGRGSCTGHIARQGPSEFRTWVGKDMETPDPSFHCVPLWGGHPPHLLSSPFSPLMPHLTCQHPHPQAPGFSPVSRPGLSQFLFLQAKFLLAFKLLARVTSSYKLFFPPGFQFFTQRHKRKFHRAYLSVWVRPQLWGLQLGAN